MSEHCELPREIDSLERLFFFLEKAFEAHAIDERTSFGIKLAAEELFTNLVRHNIGDGEMIDVVLDISDGRARLQLADHDVEPFDAESVAPVDVHLPVEQREPGGLGMHLVRSLVDQVSYRYEDRTLTVVIVKELGG